MKPSPLLLTVNALLAIFGAAPARADDMALSFDLPTIAQPEPPAAAEAETTPAPPGDGPQPLPIPKGAGSPPMRFHSPQQLPRRVYRQAIAKALNKGATPASILPPAPPQLAVDSVVAAIKPVPAAASLSPLLPSTPPEPEKEAIALSFEDTPPTAAIIAEAPPPASAEDLLLSLFEGDSDSLVARAVGSAEGTRTPSGGITAAYFGHTDPGNQAWNMGTFSYQHGAASAAEADQKQLRRLRSQSEVLRKRALSHGLTLTLEETLNGIDLANQSPRAAIGRVGYIERLAEAKLEKGLTGPDAIVVARTRSYINPNTGRWNAPGLGNTEASITRDQRRRAQAIAKAIEAYRQQQPDLDPATWSLGPPPDPSLAAAAAPKASPEKEEEADVVFQLWTDGKEPAPSLAAEPMPETENQPEGDRVSEAVERLLAVALGPLSPEPQTPSPEVSPAEQPQPTTSPPPGEQPADAIPQAALPAEPPQESPPAAAPSTPDTFSAPKAPPEASDQRPTWAEVREAHQVPALPVGETHANSPELPVLPAGNQSAEPSVMPGQEAESITPETQTSAIGHNESSSHHDATANIPAPNIPAPEVADSAEHPAEAPLELPLAAEAQAPAPPAPETVQPSVSAPTTDEPASPNLSAVAGATPDSILHFPTSPAALADPFFEESFTPGEDDLISDQPASIDSDAALQPEEEAELQRLIPRARVLRRSRP